MRATIFEYGRKTFFRQNHWGTPEKRAEATEGLAFIHKVKSKFLSPYEIPKTPEDIKLVQTVEKVVDEIVLQYGGKIKEIPISGNYLPLARTIEGILGEGEFRKTAEDFRYKPKQ